MTRAKTTLVALSRRESRSEALTYQDAADILSDALGRRITYKNPSPWAFWRRMRDRGHAAGYVLVMIALYEGGRQNGQRDEEPDG